MSTIHGHAVFHVGDRVRIDLGRRKLTGVIVEDRGPIGVHGRRLFQVEIPVEPDEPMLVELPENEIEPVAAGAAAPQRIDKDKVLKYLVSGGLISMLRSNFSGGRYQPRVWLCFDNLGNVTHSFIRERGEIGGQPPPSGAVQDNKIFTPKRDSVVSFVESFGLTQQEAIKVVAEVGTSP